MTYVIYAKVKPEEALSQIRIKVSISKVLRPIRTIVIDVILSTA